MNELTMNERTITNQTIDASLMKDFIEFIDAKPKTIQTYTRAIKQFYKYMMENGITQPKRQDIIAYRDDLQASGHKPTTIQNYIVALKQFFNWTQQMGYYPNIADHVKGVKISKDHKKDYLTSRQIGQVLKAIDTSDEKGLRDYAIIGLMATGGLRTIEVANARIEDLRTLGNDTVLYLLGKGRDERTDYIKVPDIVESAIRRYLMTRNIKDKSQPLFASTSRNNKGKGITTRTVSSIVKTRMQAVGLDDERLTAHSLRHSAVTIALLNGMDLQEVQQFARHSNIQTTMIYSHAIERAKNHCESTIAQSIFG